MRLLYLDIDTLRADHLGCYGYHRATSPNIDRVAAQGVRLARCYASDVPCLPSRTALLTGRFGTHNGVVGHGGTAAELFIDGAERGFWSRLGRTSFPGLLARRGMHTVTISSFAQRHSAFHWHAGFLESHSVPKMGLETADEVAALALDWLGRSARRDGWFLHVHLWDPHTPYRTPLDFGEPFAAEPLPAWLGEEVRAAHWRGGGPHSAQETLGFRGVAPPHARLPRQPAQADSMGAVRAIIDGYDTGVRYADLHVGRILAELERQGVLDDTAILISGDHGETLGELNIYSDHHTADEHVAHLPLILRWPGAGPANTGRVDRAFHYQIDVAATVVELVGGRVPEGWDGRSFAAAFRDARDDGRPYLVTTQGAWTAQRGVRFDDWLYLRTWHDGFHSFPDEMLFDLARDPHEQDDLARARPEVTARGARLLEEWRAEVMRTANHAVDPLETVLAEGGPFHVRGELPAYLARLRETGRADVAKTIERKHSR
jgi:choline-sulfatase